MTEQEERRGGEELRYAEALEELERILRAIEQDEIDLDELGVSVERAAMLIQVCRDKIERAELQVDRIVKSLEQEGEGDT